jgi:hypothetical protein
MFFMVVNLPAELSLRLKAAAAWPCPVAKRLLNICTNKENECRTKRAIRRKHSAKYPARRQTFNGRKPAV